MKTKTRTSKARSKQSPRTKETATHARPVRPRRMKNPTEYRPEEVIATNGTMELDPRLLQLTSARAIAQSLKRSADRSSNLRGTPFHSAMSMLNVLLSHIDVQKARLEAAKKELRKIYGEADDKPQIQEPNSPMDYARQRNSSKRNERVPQNSKQPGNRRPA